MAGSARSRDADLAHAMEALKRMDGKDVTLLDIMRFAEVMADTMHTFFGSLDKTLTKEFREIGSYISNMRAEIGLLQANDLKSERIPMAGSELDAVVRATEEATDAIMESAEAIMAADASDHDAYRVLVGDHVMRIFEACSFQDLTGQRIAKVVETLQHIEERVSRFAETIGAVEGAPRQSPAEAARERRRKELMLNGPQDKGDAIEQAAVDALFD